MLFRSALQNGISGTSVVSVVIYKDGSKGKPEIVQSSDSLLDAEALRVVSLMPEFKKGLFNVRMRMPVHFLIHGDLMSEITTREDKQPKEYKIDGYLDVILDFRCWIIPMVTIMLFWKRSIHL